MLLYNHIKFNSVVNNNIKINNCDAINKIGRHNNDKSVKFLQLCTGKYKRTLTIINKNKCRNRAQVYMYTKWMFPYLCMTINMIYYPIYWNILRLNKIYTILRINRQCNLPVKEIIRMQCSSELLKCNFTIICFRINVTKFEILITGWRDFCLLFKCISLDYIMNPLTSMFIKNI